METDGIAASRPPRRKKDATPFGAPDIEAFRAAQAANAIGIDAALAAAPPIPTPPTPPDVFRSASHVIAERNVEIAERQAVALEKIAMALTSMASQGDIGLTFLAGIKSEMTFRAGRRVLAAVFEALRGEKAAREAEQAREQSEGIEAVKTP
jgi:hypothetical protein